MADLRCYVEPAGGLRRPMLKAGLHRLRRAPGTLQFGIDPERSVLLTGLDESAERWILALDGLRDRAALQVAAEDAGLDATTADTILDLLGAAGLLEDGAASCAGWTDLPRRTRDRLAPDLASLTLIDPRPDGGKQVLSRRLGAMVEVRGGGRVGAAVAALLEAAGVGTVTVADLGTVGPADLGPAGWRADDLGRPRGAAELGARRRPDATPGDHPDLVVLAADGAGELLDAARRAPDVAHLCAWVCATGGGIGPLVVPGVTCCLRCLDLIRADRDPAWPALAVQLSAPGRRIAVPSPACDVVLATTVAGHAALQALAYLDTGDASAMDATLHIDLPEGRVRRRSWVRHPACGCGWAGATASPGAPQEGTPRPAHQRGGGYSHTMAL